MLKKGKWTLHSKSDPRWNLSGKGLMEEGVMPLDCFDMMQMLTLCCGAPPKDLTWEAEFDEEVK